MNKLLFLTNQDEPTWSINLAKDIRHNPTRCYDSDCDILTHNLLMNTI